MSIPRHLLDAINAQADLVGIIGKHTKLKPANGQFKGCCPFHNEKTPSFTVNPQKNLYHCFGCGAGGNAFNFLMDYENMTFMEAVKELAQSTGIELPKEQDKKQHTYQRTKTATPKHSPKKHTPPPPAHQDLRPPTPPQPANPPLLDGTFYGLLQAVAHFYEQKLGQNIDALRYFSRRGIQSDTLQHFSLGYAPKDWHHLQEAFPNDLEGLIALGLLRRSDKGTYYNFFRERVMFAIKNNQGQVVGFAGRAMNDEVKPKYLNSPDSPIFKKNQLLYGAYEARQKRVRDFLVVEGYMDVITLHQAGIYGAVAPMGTAMNEEQISHLLRFSDVLTLCFDGDSAGQKAALRTLETAMPVLEDGKQLHFLTLPDNHDPDTYLNTFGSKKMQETIEMAAPLSAYLAQYLQQTYQPTTPEQVATAMRYVRELTDKLPKKSSFRWSLNNAMYQSLSKKKTQSPTKHQAPKELFTSGEALMLTILYKPCLTDGDWLGRFYNKLNLQAIDKPFLTNIDPLPALPAVSDFQVGGLAELLAGVSLARPQINPNACDDITIDTYAQLIVMGVKQPKDTQKNLKKYLLRLWREFSEITKTNPIANVELMFDELLCRLLTQTLEHQQKQLDTQSGRQTLLLSNLYKRRLSAIKAFKDRLFDD